MSLQFKMIKLSANNPIHQNGLNAINEVDLQEAAMLFNLAFSMIQTWIPKAGIDFMLTTLTMVTRCAVTGEIFEVSKATNSLMETRVFEASVTLCHNS